MGYDILAYYDVDQDDIEKFIVDNNIDRNDWQDAKRVAEYVRRNCTDPPSHLLYQWNDDCDMHEVWDSAGTNFIRDDSRFDNRRFQMQLEKKVGKPFPHILTNINWSLRTREDAIEIAEGLETFFADDYDLKYFAEWLRHTAKYCSTYELSY